MKVKGMSQTLALIVTATVLLMAALTVVFLTSSSIGDFGRDTRGQGCVQTVQAQCAAKGGSGKISTPNSCFTDGKPINSFKKQTGWYQWKNYESQVQSPDTPINCSTVVG